MSEQTPSAESVVRRPRSSGKFAPRAHVSEDDGMTVGRSLLGPSRPTAPPQTSRNRVIAGDLPDWEPLPPGELVVRRRS